MGIVTTEQLENASLDAESLQTFINGDDETDVVTRLQETYPTLAKALKILMETGGWSFYSTAVELLAAKPTIVPSVAYAADTKKIYKWDGATWVDEGVSVLDQAKSYTDLERTDREALIDKTDEGSLYLTDENGIAFGQVSPSGVLFYDLVEVAKSSLEDACFLDMLTGLAIPITKIGDVGGGSDVIQIDTSKPLFSKQLCGFYDEPVLINVPSLFADRATVQQKNQVLVTLGSTDTLQAKPYYNSSRDLLEIETAKLGQTAQLVLRDTNDLSTSTKLTLSVVNVTQQSSKSVKILHLGDSITNRQAGTIIRAALEKRGFIPTFIGTLRGILNQNESANNATGEKGEGRESWKIGDFTHSYTETARQPVAVGDEAAYLAMTQSDKRVNWNPFIRVATDADSSTLIKNGYVFDPEFYRSRFSLDVPDVVVIALGINDVIPNTTTDIYNDYVLMLSQFLTQWSSVKIVVTMPTLSHQRNDVWKTAGPKVIREIQRAINAVNSSRVMLAPAWTFAPPDFGYSTPLSGGVLDEISGAITRGFDDQTHPIDAHRVKMWSSVAAYIAASII